MSWEIAEALHLNVGGGVVGVPLNYNGNGLASRAEAIQWRMADCFKLVLYLYDGILSTTPIALPAGHAIIVAGKELVSNAPSGSVLFSATGFVPETIEGRQAYTAILDLNTSELSTALGSDPYVEVQCDAEIQNAGNTRRKTFSFTAKIMAQSYAGESSPSPGTPLYPAAANLVTVDQLAGLTYLSGTDPESGRPCVYVMLNGAIVHQWVQP